MRAIERRSYLRVESSAGVFHRAITRNQADSEPVESILSLGSHFAMRQELYRLELEARELQHAVATRDRVFGSFCHNLNQRLELLGASLSPAAEGDLQPVTNLSPAGVSYISRDFHAAGDYLALRIDIHESSLAVACIGRVCYCLLLDDDQYRLGVQFLAPDSTTEALLERHVSALLAEERRRRLHNPE